MTTIVLTPDSAELAEHLHRSTGGAVVSLPVGPLPADPDDLLARLPGSPVPDVVLLPAAPGRPEEALRLAAQLGAQWPDMSVVLVSDQDTEIGLAALRAGVRDVLHPAAEPAVVRAVLDHAVTAASRTRQASATPDTPWTRQPAPSGRVISVVSPKGGVGKTTIAANLAVGLAAAEPHSTVLVDLDVQFGDVASALDLDPEFTLPDTVRGPASRDTMVLKTYLTLHRTGLYVICGAPSPVAGDEIDVDDVRRLLQMLASEFRFVIVDTAPGLSDHTLAAMDEASDLILVTSMDVPGVRGLRKELDTLTDLGMLTAARQIVLNFADPGGGLSVADVEATIGTAVDVVLPRAASVVTSVNQGVPLLESGLRGPVTDRLRVLLGMVHPAAAPPSRAPRGRRPRARPRGRHRSGGGDAR